MGDPDPRSASESRELASLLTLVASFLVPTAMLTLAYVVDRGISSCYGDWSDGQRGIYNFLLVASPFLAAGLVFAATVIGATGTWARYVLATVLGVTFLAVFGVAALAIGYYGGGCD